MTLREPVSIDGLQRAIRIWEEMVAQYKQNMDDIKKAHKITWWLRWSFWKNDKYYHVGYTGLISRRIQLQTAIKAKESAN